ncbi:hypothetical protein [Helicobacter sp. MIT 14-3879]|uniref:hypothetical protein n=1 Tax=Helicobacter sp. MIT 14-3879 TaxID=2040649 RepID=UPI000E1EC640|nr:hypothetical protein [Helicobacter sp. MIT 14-3879]RDU64197.1 hypothetical protein CQA44_04550 [Helicobacter sp. MIT 14-3879]
MALIANLSLCLFSLESSCSVSNGIPLLASHSPNFLSFSNNIRDFPSNSKTKRDSTILSSMEVILSFKIFLSFLL